MSCGTCNNMNDRINALAARIRRQKTWDKNQDLIRGMAYRLILATIERHMKETGHEVDSFPVMQALGLRRAS